MPSVKGTGKPNIRQAIELTRQADNLLEDIRNHFDMEWGDGQNTDLDLALSSAIRNLAEARSELDKVLDKFQGRALKPNYPRKRRAS